MDADDRTYKLLEEIRDAQREHLAEYRRVTSQSLELQQRGIARQEQMSQAYKRLVAFGGALAAVLLGLLLFLLIRWSDYLFR